MLAEFCNFNDYCEAFFKSKDTYCEQVNMSVPVHFCHFKCLGNWRQFRNEDAEVERLKRRPKLTQEQKDNQELVSVIIPCMKEDAEYLERTIKSVRENAVGPIEVIVITDGWTGSCGDKTISGPTVKGQRWSMNFAAKEAEGVYLFKLDAHCGMSEGWDARMKSSCDDSSIVTCTFDGLDTKTWKGKNRDSGFVRITPQARSWFLRGWKSFAERKIEEETMGLSGTAWMIKKSYYNELGGSDESLGEYGGIGSEWSLKAWLTGGKCLFRTDVVCYHLFRKNTPYDVPIGEKEATYDKLYNLWIRGEDPRIVRPMGWLVNRFRPILNRRIYKNF